jgi:hypothetical protein
MYFYFQFRGILKKNYNSVDLTEVELLDDTNGPRKLSPEIEEVCSELEFRKIKYLGTQCITWIIHPHFLSESKKITPIILCIPFLHMEYINDISINNLRSQLYSSVLYYTLISRHVSANSKPSSGVVAYRILKVSNHIQILRDPLHLC